MTRAQRGKNDVGEPPRKARAAAEDAVASAGWMAERRREAVMRLVGSMEVLPSTLAVPLRVMQLRQTPTAGAREFAEVISTDPSLSVRVLALVNSAWFSPVKKVTRVSDAVSRIGMGNLLPLIFAGSLAAVYHTMAIPTEQLDLMWRASLLKAVAGREYARCRQAERMEEAFLAGLLQDIGLVPMFAADPGMWPELAAAIDMEPAERLERERALFGVDHAAAGAMVAQRLQLPEIYVVAIRHHHDLAAVDADASQTVFTDCVRFAAAIPHQIDWWKRCGFGRLAPFLQCVTGKEKDKEKAEARPSNQAISLLESIQREYDWLLGAVGNGATSSVTFREFIQGTTRDIMRCLELAVGEATMLATTFEEREASLKSQISKLSRETDYDSLTGLLNRRGFERALAAHVADAAAGGREIGLGFMDLDNFKAINDNCGHDAGDSALKAVAHALHEALGADAIASRLGGDEFAFLVQGGGIDRVPPLGDMILDRLRRVSFEASRQRTIPLGGSIGVLWIGVPRPGASTELLVRSADQLMYEAKRGGKGRCVVARFDPGDTGRAPARAAG